MKPVDEEIKKKKSKSEIEIDREREREMHKKRISKRSDI
jgi:hypothetical protein